MFSITKALRRCIRVIPAASCVAASLAIAQGAYPTKPIQMAVSYAAGGGTDVVARVMATELGKQLGQSVVVENRVGAGGTLAVAHVAKSAPDGLSIGWFTGGPIVLAPITEASLPYNVQKDLVPVSQVQVTDQVLVARLGLKANSIGELVALAKASPGSVSMGHTGIGTAQLLAAVMLERMAGIELNQIPYKGEAPMLNDIMGERVDLGLVTATSADPLVKSGKIKILSSGGAKRALLFPSTPSMAEQGYPNFDANSHMGIYVPTGTPPDIVNKLHAAVVASLKNPEVRGKLQDMGGTPVGSSPQEFAAFLKVDSDRAAQMLKDTKVQAKP
ncbi:MAG: tripartite tricarboxylate transporter substrate binding protein [Burkholderiales bacterium]